MSKLVEVRDKLAAKRRELAEIFAKYPELDMPAEVAQDIKARNSELTDLGKEYDDLRAVDAAREANAKALEDDRRPAARMPTPQGNGRQPEAKSMLQILEEDKGYEALRRGEVKEARIFIPDSAWDGAEVKTLITSSDLSIVADRRPLVVESVQPRILVSDMMLQGTASGPSITYLEETTFTNNAAETAEGGTKPESALDWTERTETIRKIPTWIPVTDETLEDVPRAQQQITGRLRYMVERRREAQLIVGDGVAPNLLGLLNRSGVQTQAKGADPTPDAFYKAMIKIMVNADADPDGIVIHPFDWQDIRLLRTADGIYIWGSPAEAGPERLWGLTVRKTTGITENTGLVGAFKPFSEFIRRKGIEVIISTEHSTFAVENKVAIIAEERVGLAVYRGAAFCRVTGI